MSRHLPKYLKIAAITGGEFVRLVVV